MPKGAKTAQFDQIHKEAIRKEETAKIEWEKNWTWLMDEYIKLQNKLAEVSKTKPMTEIEKKFRNLRYGDERTIKPVPVTTYGEIGWLSTRPEFRLGDWGPDVPTLPLEKEYMSY